MLDEGLRRGRYYYLSDLSDGRDQSKLGCGLSNELAFGRLVQWLGQLSSAQLNLAMEVDPPEIICQATKDEQHQHPGDEGGPHQGHETAFLQCQHDRLVQ